MISKRKNIDCVEVRTRTFCGPTLDWKLGSVLVSAVNAGVEGKPTREVMRERQSDVSVSVVPCTHRNTD